MKINHVKIQFRCDNHAFSKDPGKEIARILRNLAKKTEGGDLQSRPVVDVNGNRIGTMNITRL